MRTATWAWALVLGAAALGLAALPLFGLLGYESSFVIGLLAALASAQLAGAAARGRVVEAVAAGRGRTGAVLWAWGRASGATLLLLLAPLAILVGNALRVKNCALLEGLGWYALLPGVSAATGAAAGTVAGLLARSRVGGALAGTALVLGSVAWGVVRFYTAPAVFGYDPFAGWFPGSLYDEALVIEPLLVGARALHLLGAAAALLLASTLLDEGVGRLRLRAARGRRALLAVALAVTATYGAAWRLSRPWLAPTAGDVERALGGVRTTAHLRIVYPRSAPFVRSLDWFARDAEVRWRQLLAALGPPDGTITIYLFESAEQKQRFMGAAHTQIAKPWRREIYLQWDALPHPVLAHELAHVFAGRFGDRLFGVARSGLRFNVGLIEGVAVAVGDPQGAPGALSLDEQVKAMRRLRIEPPLSSVFGLGFLGEAPARAYTVAGSFVRFLLEQRGPDALGQVFGAAGSGASWEAAYGRPFAALAADWSARIDATPLDERRLEVVAERLRRPSILHKICAHTLAARRREAARRAAAGDAEGALAVLSSVCADDPDDPDALLAVMDQAAAAGDSERAAATAEQVLEHKKAADVHRYRALLHLGDAALRAALDAEAAHAGDAPERYARADARYRQALTLRLDDDSARQLRARLQVSASRARLPLGRYLVGEGATRDPAFDLLRAQQVIDATPDEGLGYYLLGRMLATRDRFAEAVPLLDRAQALGLPEGGFAPAARRLAAIAAFRAGDLGGARERFGAIAADRSDPGAAREAYDWLARCDLW